MKINFIFRLRNIDFYGDFNENSKICSIFYHDDLGKNHATDRIQNTVKLLIIFISQTDNNI